MPRDNGSESMDAFVREQNDWRRRDRRAVRRGRR
jgi:hypothetical protein